MMKSICKLIFVAWIMVYGHLAEGKGVINIEEQRISKAQQAMPNVLNRFDKNLQAFKSQLTASTNHKSLNKWVRIQANTLWKTAVASLNRKNDFDDRPLYWARLKMARSLRLSPAYTQLSQTRQRQLQWQLELTSRGKSDVLFDKKADLNILVTGFDPFFLDRHINQSNPSGVAALALDNLLINADGKSAEVESLIVPVRFADFDQGMIEELLTPYIKKQSIDMIITISMGRDHFDLERFPGLRRSTKAPDNLNIYTGASPQKPLVPLLVDKPLTGPEFVEFSLPVKAMKKARGAYRINDNPKITTLKKTFSPTSLKELDGQIAVAGSGGGYLSNEISYRSILLRNQFRPKLPVGHVHTPRFKGFDPKKSQDIVKQIKAMIKQAIMVL